MRLLFTPMLLGIQYGSGPIASGNLLLRENISLFALTVIVILFAALLVNPATTRKINKPNSIAEFTEVSLGGKEQTLLIRGYDQENPVLLYLAGVPGGTDLGAMRMFLSDLEKDYIVVTWDQRGGGKSYPALDPTETLTLEQTISDTTELTNYLRIRFSKEKYT
jgi:proline iminopeptidase